MSFVVELCITDKCNLGCKYCYSANRNKFMTVETLHNVVPKIHQYMEKSGEHTYVISYFGGEPLLNFDLIKEGHEIFKNDPDCKFECIISNMTLLDREKYNYIKDQNIGVSWSFDGIGSNESRPLLKMKENAGYNSILDIYQDKHDMLLDLSKGSCKVMIYPGNAANMTENFKFLLDFGLIRPDFSLVRDDVWTAKDIAIFKYELHRLADFYISEVQKRECSIGFFRLHFLDTLLGFTRGKRPQGCFAGCSGCAVTPDGEFYPCQRFASKKILKYDDNFDFAYYKQQFSPKNFEKCKDCDMYYSCTAGCTFSQLLNNNEPLDSICELYHIISEETFRVVHELKNCKNFHKVIDSYIASLG